MGTDTFLVPTTSFVGKVGFSSRVMVSHGGVCSYGDSRLRRIVPLATPTFGSAARKSPLARPSRPSSGWTKTPLALPTTGSVMGRVTPGPCGVSPRVKKPLARPTLGPSVESSSPLLRPTAGSSGCSPRPRPSQGTPVMSPRSGGLIGSIQSTFDINCREKTYYGMSKGAYCKQFRQTHAQYRSDSPIRGLKSHLPSPVLTELISGQHFI